VFLDSELNGFDWYVTITRGGLITAQLLSHISGMKKIDTLCISSYEGQAQKELKIFPKDYWHLKDQRILLIDELIEGGKTMQTAVDFLQKFEPKEIKTFVLFTKEGASFEPDYCLQKRPKDQWIHFKYDNLKAEDIIPFVEKK
jgi:hypoxanthine phosphoribosyltransferase